MYRYAEYCPLAATSDVLGDYWTPLIIRELLFGTNHFNQLVRNLPEISRSLLSLRLRSLERANVVTRHRGASDNVTSYALTDAGHDLAAVIEAMNSWGSRWAISLHDPEGQAPSASRRLELVDVEPMGTICMLKSRVRTAELPPRRVAMEVLSRGRGGEARAWILCEHGSATLCATPPPYEVDVYVEADNVTLYRIWRQQLTMGEALRCGEARVEGAREALREFVRWFDGPSALVA